MSYEGMAVRDQETGFTMARDVAGAALNPINWYMYNPGMWSASRGQVKVPFLSGKSIQSVSNLIGKMPFVGASWQKRMDKIEPKGGGIMTSKGVWLGAKAKAEAGLAGWYMPQDNDLLKKIPADRRNMLAPPKYIPSKVKVRPFLYERSPTIIGRFKDFTRDKIEGIRRAGVGKTVVRRGFQAAATLGKGFAVLGAATLAWEAINYIAEPLGRAAFSAMDASFRAFEGVPGPELGGRLAMAYLSNGSATEKQRSLRAISKAHINGRSALGGEAAMVHRGG